MSIRDLFRRKPQPAEDFLGRFTSRVTFRETRLGSIQDIRQLTLSPDGKHEAYLVRHGQGWAVGIDGAEGQVYDGIGDGSLRFSVDGTRSAYAAETDGNWVAVIDGVESQPSEGICSIAFSPDNSHVAYAARVKGKTCLILDGNAGAEYDAIESLAFVNTVEIGWQPVFLAKRGTKFMLVRGAKEGKEYTRVGGLVANPYTDAYYAINDITNLTCSPDGSHTAFVANPERVGGAWYVVRDGLERKAYTDIGAFLAFSADGNELAYAAQEIGGDWVVRRNHKRYGSYDSVPFLRFAPSGNKLVWTARVGQRSVVYSDEACGPEFEDVDSETFSPDGSRVAYRVLQNGKWRVVLDAQKGKAYEGVGEGSLVFTGDSRSLAYVAGDGGKFLVVVDGVESERYEGLQAGSLVASPDGRFIAYQVTGRPNQAVLLVNGQESQPYGGFLGDRESIYCSDNTFHVIAVREGSVFRVDVQPVAP